MKCVNINRSVSIVFCLFVCLFIESSLDLLITVAFNLNAAKIGSFARSYNK